MLLAFVKNLFARDQECTIPAQVVPPPPAELDMSPADMMEAFYPPVIVTEDDAKEAKDWEALHRIIPEGIAGKPE